MQANKLVAGGSDESVKTVTTSGDVSISISGTTATTTIVSNAVTNAKAADMANATIKGRSTSGTGDPEDLTAAQVAALLANNLPIITSSSAPVAPATNQLWFETTSGILWYWDGTYWLSTNLFQVQQNFDNYDFGEGAIFGTSIISPDNTFPHDIKITAFNGIINVPSANDASNYVTFNLLTIDNGSPTVALSIDTSDGNSGVYLAESNTTGLVLDLTSGIVTIQFNGSGTGNPGQPSGVLGFTYRLKHR